MVKARFANFNSFFYHTLFYYIKMKNVLRTIGINLLFELLFISLGTHSFSRNAKSPWARRFNYVFFFLLEIMDFALNRANCEMILYRNQRCRLHETISQ